MWRTENHRSSGRRKDDEKEKREDGVKHKQVRGPETGMMMIDEKDDAS